jgi:[protein-PII] uridylyltransferase
MIQTHDTTAVKEEETLFRIRKMIDDTLAGKFILTEQLGEKTKAISKRQKAMLTAPRVSVTNEMSKTHTVLEISGSDRPQLLYDVTRKIAQLGLQINSASVSTYGDRAVDVFYVKDIFGMKIATEKMIEKIRTSLLQVLKQSDKE